MNARFILSRVLFGLLAAATLVLTGCAGSPRMAVPYDRPYQYDFWHLHASVGYGQRTVGGGGCITTRYDSAIPFTVAVPCAPSVNGATQPGQSLERSRYSLRQLEPKLTEVELIQKRHCAYSAAPDQHWPAYKCQTVVNEIAYLQGEITKEERAVGPKCRHGLSELTGRQVIRSKECDETEYGAWRKK